MSDGLGFSVISGTFLEKVASNERLSRDLPRRGRDPKHGCRHGGAVENTQPDEPDTAQGEFTPRIDVRI